MGLQSGIGTARVSSALDAGARRPVLLASILLAALLALMVFGVAQAQDPGISLVNETANVVERRKDGGFIARPVFDRRLAFLAYAVRDPDSGDWLTGVTQVRGGENRLSNGWEYGFLGFTLHVGHRVVPDQTRLECPVATGRYYTKELDSAHCTTQV